MLNNEQRSFLLKTARQSIEAHLNASREPSLSPEPDPVLQEKAGVFVSLHQAGELRGCIGCLEPVYPLLEAVRRMAVEAAVSDPRFSSLALSDLPAVKIEISVLSRPEKVSGPEKITIPGDGVIVRCGYRSGVFLPQVADETGWDRETFLSMLCSHKAGLPPDAWRDKSTELYTFQAEVFSE